MNITQVLLIITSILLIVLVTLQSSDSSLGSGFSSVTKSGFHTKRGPEKLMYLVTIAAAIIFVLLSFLNIILSQ